MPSVVLFTVHYYGSKRKAGFHWLAEAYEQLGWDVTVVTVALSHLSRLRKDHRLDYAVRAEANSLKRVRPGLQSYVLFSTLHPANLRNDLLNRLAGPVMRRYAHTRFGDLEGVIREASLLIVESCAALLFVPRLRRINPAARLVYRVSDDLRYNNNHPVVIEAEHTALPEFDLVSSPSRAIHSLYDSIASAALQHHGIDKDELARPRPNPFPESKRHNAVFVGNSALDHDFLRLASHALPGWHFHVIGALPGVRSAANVTAYGELPFSDTVAYLQHADAGLQTLAYRPGAEAFTDSLKVLQYTFLRLPIVAPEFLRGPRPNVFYYQPADVRSIVEALQGAASIDRSTIPTGGIRSWQELASDIAGHLSAAPRD